MTGDIFEDLRQLVRCDFISDLQTHPHRELARLYAGEMELEGYELGTLSDLAEYLYDTKEPFENHAQARAFFQSRVGP